jgi:hypothetical protein
MLHKIRAALALPRRDLATLAHAWLLLLVIDLGLRTVSLRRLEGWLCKGRRRQRSADTAALALRLHSLVAIAARHHWVGARCLHRSLALQHLLLRRGVATRLRIGVRREGESLEAHAWLEWQGQAIGEPYPDFESLDLSYPGVG